MSKMHGFISGRRISGVICLLILLAGGVAFGQTVGTIGGRATDQTGAVIVGATVTATNTATGITRTAPTNSDGLYSLPALQPGTYTVGIQATGFGNTVKNGVNLVGDSTITVDFQLRPNNVSQTVEVAGGGGTAVETTDSQVTSSVQTSEVENLPMLNRTFSGLVTLTPEARPAPILNSTKLTFGGGISVGGGSGRSVVSEVDGAENRDDIVGGPMMNFSIEGIQEFKLLAHSFTAQYGRGSAGVLEVVTKSGTNQLHGTAFGFGRNTALTAEEYLNKVGNIPKTSYAREQFGGSLGGPIKKDRWFLFGALERTLQSYTYVLPNAVYQQAVIAQNGADGIPGIPGLDAVPSELIPQPFHDFLNTERSDYTVNEHHSMFLRFAFQKQYAYDDQFYAVNSTNQPHPDINPNDSYDLNHSALYSIVAGETWVISPRSVNIFTVQDGSYNTTQVMPTTEPPSEWPLQNVDTPSIELGRTGPSTNQEFFETRWEFKDDFTHEMGRHSLKFGGGYDFFPSIGMGILLGATTGRTTFFADPSTITASAAEWKATPGACTVATCGAYPEGFVTPGAVVSLSQGEAMACDCNWQIGGPGDARLLGMKDWDGYFQDDWKVKPRLTLNIGLRYDLPINSFNQTINANNRAYEILHPITPIACTTNCPLPIGYEPIATHTPGTPENNFSPRFGFAWDLKGNGKTVIRGGGGLYWDKVLMEEGFQQALISEHYIDTAETLVDTGAPNGTTPANIQGTGQLGNYVFGRGCVVGGTGCNFTTPLPQNVAPFITNFPTNIPGGANIAATIWGPGLQDPYNTQEHLGFTHAFTPNLTLSVDGTHILGLHEMRERPVNPIENAWDPSDQDKHLPWGSRRYSNAFNAAYPGLPNLMGAITMWETNFTLSKFNELASQLTYRTSRMTLNASYTIASAWAFGGVIDGNLGGTSAPIAAGNSDYPEARAEWAPAATDERSRAVFSGVFELPWGLEASPIMQASTARPYTLTQGTDLNGDGANTDLYIKPGTGSAASTCGCTPPYAGTQVSVNSQRGTPIFDVDARVTKTLKFGERMNLGMFAEFYNISNRANFGNYYYGKATSSQFETPFSYMLGYPTSRQLQIGARYSF